MATPARVPDFIPDSTPDFIPDSPAASDPQPAPSATSRFLAGAKAGSGGENILNTPVDPKHPISTNAMIPGSGVYRDIKSGNYAGALGRIAGPAAELLPMIGMRGENPAEGLPSEPIRTPSSIGTKVGALGKVAAQDAISRIPVAGRITRRPSIGDYWNAITAKPAPIEAPPNPHAELLRRAVPDSISNSQNPPFTTRHEGLPEVEEGQGIATAHLKDAIGNQPPSILQKPIAQRRIGDLLNDSLGGKPLEPKTPLRNQGNRITSDIAQTPTVTPTESSVIKSYKYDPAKREFQATTTGGATYIHGDVSPEQAKAFEQAPSKGTAWKELKDNSTYVGKVVNGQRVNVKPPISSRSADPNDLTQLLEDSLSQVNKKKLGK